MIEKITDDIWIDWEYPPDTARGDRRWKYSFDGGKRRLYMDGRSRILCPLRSMEVPKMRICSR